MRQIPDPEQPSIGLGKPIREEQAEAKDEWEQFKGQHGTNMRRNKRTGAIETDQIPSGPQYPPPAPDLGFIFTSDAWDAVIKGMQQSQPLPPMSECQDSAAWKAYGRVKITPPFAGQPCIEYRESDRNAEIWTWLTAWKCL